MSIVIGIALLLFSYFLVKSGLDLISFNKISAKIDLLAAVIFGSAGLILIFMGV